MAVGTGGDVHHHRRLVTRTGGDEVADHHCRLVTRAGGVEAHHRRLRDGTDGVALFSFYFPQPAPQISSCPARSNPVRRAPQSPPPSPRPGRRPCAVPRPGIQTRRRPRAPSLPPSRGAASPESRRRRPRVEPPSVSPGAPPTRSHRAAVAFCLYEQKVVNYSLHVWIYTASSVPHPCRKLISHLFNMKL